MLAGGVAAALVGAARSETELAAQADKLGVPVSRLQELQYVAEQTGSSAENLQAALQSLASANPRIRDTAEAFELVSSRMRDMNEVQRKVYAQRLGIDQSLIPMMTEDVAGLRSEFAAMYSVAGTDAQAAAEASRGFMNELGKLKTLASMLSRTVAVSFLGEVRGSMETLRRAMMENFDRIRRVLQVVIGFILRMAGVISSFVYRILRWAASIVAWFDSLDEGQRKLLVGVGLLVAAWKMLNLSFLATPLGMLIAGLTAIFALVDDYLTFMEGGESLFDWSPWAASIQRCLDVLKTLWNLLCALGSAVAAALEPLFGAVQEGFGLILRTLGNLGQALIQLFTGDFSGALSSAGALFTDWAAAGQRIAALLCESIASFFAQLWESVTASFPDFAQWAEGAASALRNAFGAAVDWVKSKLNALLGLLPDFVREKLGWKTAEAAPSGEDGQEEGQEEGGEDGREDGGPGGPAPALSLPQTPDFSRPALVPSAARQETLNDSRSMRIEAKTEIHVNGAQNPAETARQVAGQQNSVNADMVRHAQGAAW